MVTDASKGRYKIVNRLSQRPNSTVYEAHDDQLDRDVALKLVRTPEGEDNTRYAAVLAREARYIARLEHPHIVPVYDFATHDEAPVMVLKLVRNGDLNAACASGRAPTRRAVQIGRQVATALDFCRSSGIAHRDVKPDNILLDVSDHVYVADFGLACELDSDAYHHGQGHERFISPEQLNKSPVQGEGDRCDQFSLGVTLFRMLTGHYPVGAHPNGEAGRGGACTAYRLMLREPLHSVTEWLDVPVSVDDVFERMLSIHPADRFATCSAAIDALESAIQAVTGPVFVSYASEDRAVVSDLVARLKDRGVPCWWDSEGIRGGAVWEREIDRQLRQASAMIVVWSENARASEWVEIEYAFWLENRGRESSSPLIPVVISEAPLSIRLSRLQAVRGEHGDMDRAVDDICSDLPAAIFERVPAPETQHITLTPPGADRYPEEDLVSITTVNSIAPEDLLVSLAPVAGYIPARYNLSISDFSPPEAPS